MQNIIVMSHLRWNSVHQRPQHLLSRLATHYRILFFEEPVCHPKKHLAVISEPHPNVMVWTPYTPVEAQGFHDDQLRFVLCRSCPAPFTQFLRRGKDRISIQETRKSMFLRDQPEASTSSDSLRNRISITFGA